MTKLAGINVVYRDSIKVQEEWSAILAYCLYMVVDIDSLPIEYA